MDRGPIPVQIIKLNSDLTKHTQTHAHIHTHTLTSMHEHLVLTATIDVIITEHLNFSGVTAFLTCFSLLVLVTMCHFIKSSQASLSVSY